MVISPPHKPDTNAVSIAVSNALSEATLDDQSCYVIEEGTEHVVWSIGDFVFRALPQTGRSHGKHEASLDRDKRVTDLIRQHAPKPSYVPRVVATVAVEGWIGNVEAKLDGHSLQKAQSSIETENELVEFLDALAATPIEQAMDATGFEEPRPNLRSRTTKAIRVWRDVLVPSGLAKDPRDLMFRFLEDTLADTKRRARNAPQYRPSLIHGDISGEHILVDAEGRVNGIIDWSEARVGDPCWDIAGIVLSVGRSAAMRIGERSIHPDDTVRRGVLLAMCLALQDLGDHVVGKEKAGQALLYLQITRAFEGTGFEGLLLLHDETP